MKCLLSRAGLRQSFVYVRVCIRVCVHACMHVCVRACMRVCVCVCACVRVYTITLFGGRTLVMVVNVSMILQKIQKYYHYLWYIFIVIECARACNHN